MRKFWLICLCLSAWSFSVCAKESSYSATSVEIIPEVTAVSANRPLSVLVKITPKDDWHIYWNNPGDTGLPTEVKLTSPFGTSLFKQQSAPKHFFLHHLVTQYAYDDTAYWLFKIRPNSKQPFQLGDDVSLSADVSWMACKDECVTESLTVTQTLPIENKAQPSSLWEKELYQAHKTFPNHYQNGYFQLNNHKINVYIPHFKHKISELIFIPFVRDLLINHQPVQFETDENGSLHIEALLNEDAVFPQNLKTILLTDKGIWQVSLTQQVFETHQFSQTSIWLILLMAFTGGLILNLMPCIFPILFLKLINLLNSAYSRQKVCLEALMYFLGVVSSFMGIAGLLFFLQKSGDSLGWGFQLQSPIFIAVLFILFFCIGLMFLDIIQVSGTWFNRFANPTNGGGNLNSFLTGLFAVLIASPCSAPFMGAAIGYSITQPWYIYFPVFGALAVGYALPFTLIGLFPRVWAKILPKPGRWMLILKKIFALPIFATCLWLGWVFYHQISVEESSVEETQDIVWQDFSEDKIQALRAANRPVFIDFTAKWCLTCLVNEKTALASRTFAKLVRNKNIALFKADWTTQDEMITQALARYERNSVPLYVYYNGKDQEPIILPQLLTPSLLKENLKH